MGDPLAMQRLDAGCSVSATSQASTGGDSNAITGPIGRQRDQRQGRRREAGRTLT